MENISLKNVNLIPSLAYGRVIQNYDEKYPKKVKVVLRNVFGLEDNEVWADVLTSYAGNGYGNYCMPEVDSEVVVAFIMNDRNFPIVIGNVWTAKEDLPQDTINKDNYIKRLKTASGNDIRIDDTKDKSLITVKTANGLNVCLSDEDNSISIYDDKNTNRFNIDFENRLISIDAKDKISFKVNGTEVVTIDEQSVDVKTKTVSIRADSKIELNGGQISADGTDVKLKSKGSLSIKANGNLSAEATGITKVKGSMLNLN